MYLNGQKKHQNGPKFNKKTLSPLSPSPNAYSHLRTPPPYPQNVDNLPFFLTLPLKQILLCNKNVLILNFAQKPTLELT